MRKLAPYLAGIVIYVCVVGLYIGVASLRAGGTTEVASEQEKYRIVPPEPATLIVEPDDGTEPVLKEIENASSSIDMVMYELKDEDVESALAAAAGRGVSVRVILDNGYYGAGSETNATAFNYLKSHNVSVEWSSSRFALTHEKSIVIDRSKALILTFNLDSTYYAQDRDLGILDPDAADVVAIEQTFNADWNETPSNLTSGDDLVWSPNSKQLILAMITSARKSLLVTSEELEDPDVINALAAASGRGVQVQLLMTDSSEWHSAFDTLKKAGVQIHLYSLATSKAALYIHEKLIIADNTQAFIGSQNFTTNSLEENRELGILVSTPKIIQRLKMVFESDWNLAEPYMN